MPTAPPASEDKTTRLLSQALPLALLNLLALALAVVLFAALFGLLIFDLSLLPIYSSQSASPSMSGSTAASAIRWTGAAFLATIPASWIAAWLAGRKAGLLVAALPLFIALAAFLLRGLA